MVILLLAWRYHIYWGNAVETICRKLSAYFRSARYRYIDILQVPTGPSRNRLKILFDTNIPNYWFPLSAIQWYDRQHLISLLHALRKKAAKSFECRHCNKTNICDFVILHGNICLTRSIGLLLWKTIRKRRLKTIKSKSFILRNLHNVRKSKILFYQS